MILFYLLKVSACTAIFFALYYFALSKLTFFSLNRSYLLLTLALSFGIPALTIENKHEVVVAENSATKIAYSKGGFTEQEFADDAALSPVALNWNQILAYAYCSVLAILVLRLLFMIVRVKLQLQRNKVSNDGRIIFVNERSAIKNCSFFNQIVVDISLPPIERDLVIRHEWVHVAQLHALDKVLVNLATAVLWFNPVIYFWRNAIDHNHEFLADRKTSESADKKLYATLLLNLAMPGNQTLANSFSKLPLKNRIKMLYKKPNTRIQKLAYIAVVPVLLVCSMAFINQKEIIVTKTLTAPERQNVYVPKFLNSSFEFKPHAKPIVIPAEITLLVDAGHGGKDGAAVAVDGQKEKDLNLRAVRILKEEAEKRGIKVMLTRNSDKYLSLRERLPQEPVTAFISIHHNSTSPNAPITFGGIEVFVSKTNANIKSAENLGAGILNKLRQLNGIAVRDSLKDANLLVLRESVAPAILIELGNVSDQRTLNFVNEEKNIRKISNLILDGFVQFSKRGC